MALEGTLPTLILDGTRFGYLCFANRVETMGSSWIFHKVERVVERNAHRLTVDLITTAQRQPPPNVPKANTATEYHAGDPRRDAYGLVCNHAFESTTI